MAYINKINIGEVNYLIEPTLYVVPNLANETSSIYSGSLSNFELTNGIMIQAQFGTTNPSSAKLKIGTGSEVPLCYGGDPLPANFINTSKVYNFIYDGTNWELISDANTGLTQYGILYADTSYSYNTLPLGPEGKVLVGTASAPVWYNGLKLDGTSSATYSATFENLLDIKGNTLLEKQLNVYGNTTISGSIGIGATTSNSYRMYVAGDSLFKGDLIPETSSSYDLGSSTKRWQALYIGSSDTYGDVNTPIYWNAGAPAQVAVTQQYNFTFTSGSTSCSINTSYANSDKAIVTQICVNDTTAPYLLAPIEWTTTTSKITLETTAATSSIVSGYILVSTGS